LEKPVLKKSSPKKTKPKKPGPKKTSPQKTSPQKPVLKIKQYGSNLIKKRTLHIVYCNTHT